MRDKIVPNLFVEIPACRQQASLIREYSCLGAKRRGEEKEKTSKSD
jgi:hypothetical protein